VNFISLYSLFFGINKIIAGKIPVNDFYTEWPVVPKPASHSQIQMRLIFEVVRSYPEFSLKVTGWNPTSSAS
jgi:hypothetical protein